MSGNRTILQLPVVRHFVLFLWTHPCHCNDGSKLESIWNRMDKHIDADGWCPQNNWRKVPCNHNSTACADTYYAEHNSSGPGGSPNGRVAWSHQLTQSQVKSWTPQRVLRGWIPPPVHAFAKSLKK